MQHVTECHVEPIEGAAGSADLNEAVHYTLTLAGLGCPNCANRVQSALLRTPGVFEAEIDLHGTTGRVWCRPEFTPDTPGEIPFQCQMGMLRGKVVVKG